MKKLLLILSLFTVSVHIEVYPKKGYAIPCNKPKLDANKCICLAGYKIKPPLDYDFQTVLCEKE